ncbi:MAG: hypothetical protein K5661_04025 [Bacteroidales bacterium]|nr:hypothetical protein [Bacteroidales bacterium]
MKTRSFFRTLSLIVISARRVLSCLLMTACLAGCFIPDEPGEPNSSSNNGSNPNSNTNPGTTPGNSPDDNPEGQEWNEVSGSEGTISYSGATLKYPEGTFSKGDKVGITPVQKGQIAGDMECSGFYKITLPSGGTAKEMNLLIDCENAGPDKTVVVNAPTWNRHTGEDVTMNTTVYSYYSEKNNTFRIVVPPVEVGGNQTIAFTVGVVKHASACLEDTKAAMSEAESVTQAEGTETKASSYQYAYTWAMDSFSWAHFLVYSTKYSEINEFLSKYIPDAHAKLESLGFVLPNQKIIYRVEQFPSDDDSWGYMQSDKLIKTWGYVRLNAKKLYEMANQTDPEVLKRNQNQIKQTLVHETSHVVHEFVYDPRSAPVITATGLMGDGWAMMSEAIGCWTEKTTGDMKIGENAPYLSDDFIREFIPNQRSYLNYRNTGYGMGLFIEFMSKNLGDKSIVKLYEYQRDGKAGDLVEAYNKLMKGSELENVLNDMDEYHDFLRSVITGGIDERAEFMQRVDRTTYKGNVLHLHGGVFKMGVLRHRVFFEKETVAENNGKSVKVTQTHPDMISYIYLREDTAQYKIVAVTSDNMPGYVSMEDIGKYGRTFYVATYILKSNSIDWNYDLNKKNGAQNQIDVELEQGASLGEFDILSLLGEFTTDQGSSGRVSLYANNKNGYGQFKSQKSGNNYSVEMNKEDDEGWEKCTFTIRFISPGQYEIVNLHWAMEFSSVWDSSTNPVTMQHVSATLDIDRMPQVNIVAKNAWWEANSQSNITYSYKNDIWGDRSYSKAAGVPVGDNCFRVQIVLK